MVGLRQVRVEPQRLRFRDLGALERVLVVWGKPRDSHAISAGQFGVRGREVRIDGTACSSKWIAATLVTDLLPQGGSYAGTAPHGAPSNDLNTPLLPDGTPALREAWRYVLTADDELDEDDEHE